MPFAFGIKTATALSSSLLVLIACGGGSNGAVSTADTAIAASNIEAVAAGGLEIMEGIINGADFADASLVSGVAVNDTAKGSTKLARAPVRVAINMLNRLSYQQDMPVAAGAEITRTVQKADEIRMNDGTLTVKARIASDLEYTPGDKTGFVADNCGGDGIAFNGKGPDPENIPSRSIASYAEFRKIFE